MSRSICPSAERVLITSNGAKRTAREFYVDLYCVAFDVRGILQNTSLHRRLSTLLKPGFPITTSGPGCPLARRYAEGGPPGPYLALRSVLSFCCSKHIRYEEFICNPLTSE